MPVDSRITFGGERSKKYGHWPSKLGLGDAVVEQRKKTKQKEHWLRREQSEF